MPDLHPYKEFKRETVGKIIDDLWPKDHIQLFESLYDSEDRVRPLSEIVSYSEAEFQIPSWIVCQIYTVADTAEMCWAETEDLDEAWAMFNGDIGALTRNLLDLTNDDYECI